MSRIKSIEKILEIGPKREAVIEISIYREETDEKDRGVGSTGGKLYLSKKSHDP